MDADKILDRIQGQAHICRICRTYIFNSSDAGLYGSNGAAYHFECYIGRHNVHDIVKKLIEKYGNSLAKAKMAELVRDYAKQ